MAQPSANSSLPALLGALAAVTGASVCCVVPLLLVLMGVSGAWIANLTALDAWRPWFSAAALICLAWAFWGLYGPASRCSTNAELACANPVRLRRRRRWLWVATVVIALLLLFPYYIGWLA